MNQSKQKKFRGMQGVLAFTLAFVLIVSICPMKVQAAQKAAPPKLQWTGLGKGVYQLEGTQIKAEIAPGTVHLTGTGALPDYDYWELKTRPWATNECEAVTVDGSITSLGAYAFYDLPKLKYINISSTTFIKDHTTFYNNDQRPIVRIQGSAVTTEMIGTIPYTSMDSIKAMAQSAYTGAAYILDNNTLASQFQGSTNPTIKYVYSATDSRAPWNDLVTYGNGNVYTSICRLSANTPSMAYTVTGTRRYQGKECYQAFATAMGDFTFGTSFNITVTSNDAAKTKITKTPTPFQYVLSIPKDLQQSGRVFKLIALGEGKLNLYDDIDATGDTITFTTDYPSTAYALVYK
ncbi:MAG: hypothetical protein RRX92_00510 [Lachnospiraceae bacterium]